MVNMPLETFTKDTDFPFCIQLGSHNENLFMHSHSDFSELMLVLNGTATHIVGTDEYIIKKGDVFVFNGDMSHGLNNTHDLKICNIMYKPEQLHQYCYDFKKIPGYLALFMLEPFYLKENSFKSMLKLTIPAFEYVMNLITCMLNEYRTKAPGYKAMIHSRFIELVVYLSREYGIYNEHRSQRLFNIAKTISYMEDHFLEPIKINELADMARVSVRHFNRIFKENYDITPINYIIQLRLQHACSLLKKCENSISDIAFQSGFLDSNYFTRQFKKTLGLTPKEYQHSTNS